MWQVFRLNFFQLTILYLFSFNIVHLKPPDRTILGLKHKLKREETSHELDFNDCHYLNESNFRRIYSSDQMNNKITQCDLIITVKTTKQNHQNKLMNIIQTWFNLIQSKVIYLFELNTFLCFFVYFCKFFFFARYLLSQMIKMN